MFFQNSRTIGNSAFLKRKKLVVSAAGKRSLLTPLSRISSLTSSKFEEEKKLIANFECIFVNFNSRHVNPNFTNILPVSSNLNKAYINHLLRFL